MPMFALMCFDKPNAIDLRMATREAHLGYLREHLEGVKVAGPMLSETGEMVGSLFMLEAPDLATVQALNAHDPYTQAGLFERVEIKEFRITVGQL